jgi:hypothetical protein
MVGHMLIRINKKTGAVSVDNRDLDEDRILEMLREITGKITHITCPGLEDGPDPDDLRAKYTHNDEVQNKERSQ